jgi:ABC-2 type transport system ATP-binding protein
MIQIRNLSYRYANNRPLFHDLTMDLLPGGIYGLLGKNGAGKSTLIKNIGGILFPTTGSCHVYGQQPRFRQVSFLKDIFFIPEECYLPNLSIKQFIRIYAPYYPGFDTRQFHSYLQTFGLESSRKLHSLSYGQKKKTMIGFALATNTKVLIMDEPTNGLDIPAKVTFRNMMNDAFKPDRIVIISSHQVRDLDELITALIIIDQGEVLLQAEVAAILRRLRFASSADLVSGDPVIYAEKAPNGWSYISENSTGGRTYLDIELLFNAVLEKREAFTKMLTHSTPIAAL